MQVDGERLNPENVSPLAQVTYVNKEEEVVAEMDVPCDRYIHYAFEDAEVDIPIINRARMCRNGCCTTCAVKVKEGKVSNPLCGDTGCGCRSCVVPGSLTRMKR